MHRVVHVICISRSSMVLMTMDPLLAREDQHQPIHAPLSLCQGAFHQHLGLNLHRSTPCRCRPLSLWRHIFQSTVATRWPRVTCHHRSRTDSTSHSISTWMLIVGHTAYLHRLENWWSQAVWEQKIDSSVWGRVLAKRRGKIKSCLKRWVERFLCIEEWHSFINSWDL